MPRVSQVHLDARREQILAAAERCFARHGFHATSMTDIARETGMSAGAFYTYFQSKEEIVLALVVETTSRIQRGVAEALRDEPGIGLARLVEVVISVGVGSRGSNGSLLPHVWSEVSHSAAVRDTMQRHGAVMHELITALVEPEPGDGPDYADDVGWAILALSMGAFFSRTGFSNSGLPPDRIVRALGTYLSRQASNDGS